MAQFTGGTDFDLVWEEWSNASLTLLREAADTFAKSGESALTPEAVVTTLFSLLAMPTPNVYWGRPRWPLRFFDGTMRVAPVQESFAKLAPPHQRANCTEVVAELTRVISSAATEWSLGNPEQPAARDILGELFGLLWSRRLISRPPSKKYPSGV